MSIRKYVTVKCDEPECWASVSAGGNATAIRATLREVDWLVGIRGKDFCPAHKNTDQPPPDQPVPYVPQQRGARP